MFTKDFLTLLFSTWINITILSWNDVIIEWEDNETVIINDNEVNIKNDYFEKLKGVK